MVDAGGHGKQDLVDIQPIREAGTGISFSERLARDGMDLCRTSLDVLQVYVGKLCNQACHHCHVDASPTRTEIMTRATIDRILGFLAASDIQTVDITGGAPELIPDYRYLVESIRATSTDAYHSSALVETRSSRVPKLTMVMACSSSRCSW